MMVVDLFSGTGAATQAFVDRGHRVIRVDLEGTPDIRADVRHLPLRAKPDFVWASPPCTEFSLARRKPGNIDRGMSLIAAACDAIAELNPQWWVLENVHGAKKYLGTPTKTVRSWCLWGHFPPFDAQAPWKYQMAGCEPKGYVITKSGRRRLYGRKNAYATVPVAYSISKALCMALERELA